MRHFIVSDLHLSMGRQSDGSLHPLEDFDSHDQFDELLGRARREHAAVVVNGDWLDFLQLDPIPPIGDYRSIDGIPLFYTVREALDKLRTSLQQQERHFQALREYLHDGGRLTIIQGNHDADLFFPSPKETGEPPLQAKLREVLAPPSHDALRFVATSIRIGTVHIEHGHQRCEPLNAFQGHPEIFHADRVSPLTGRARMELLWGSRLVAEFFNDLERKHPFADNLKPTTRAVWLGIKNRWVTGKVVAGLLRFLWQTGVPADAIAEVLEGNPDPVLMVQGLPDPHLRQIIFDRMSADPTFQSELIEESAALGKRLPPPQRPGARAEFGPEEITAFGEPHPTLNLIREARELREARRILAEDTQLTAVVFGHTHQEIDGAASDAPVARYFNTGTWTPRIDLRDATVKARLRQEEFPEACLSDGSLFQRRLMYADVEDGPAATTIALREISPA